MLGDTHYKKRWKYDWDAKVREAIELIGEADSFRILASLVGVERRNLQYHCTKLITTIKPRESLFEAFKREIVSGLITPESEIIPVTPINGSGYCHLCGKAIVGRHKKEQIFCSQSCSSTFMRSKINIRPTWTAWDEHFFDELTPDGAYILGLIIADGHVIDAISGRGSRNYTIGLHQKDPQILARIAEVLKFEGDLSDSGNSPCTKLALGSKHAWEVLTDEYGIAAGKQKSYEARIPKKILEDKPCLPHFIRGLFDGDGYIDKKLAHFGLSSGSEGLTEDFTAVLVREIGLPLREKSWANGNYDKTDGTRSGCWVIRWTSMEDCMAFARYIYGLDLDVYGSDLYLRRKKERLTRFFVLWRDEDWLRERYVIKGRSMKAIASEAKVRPHDIGMWISKYNLNQERSQHWNLELGL